MRLSSVAAHESRGLELEILEHVSDAVLLCDDEARVTYCNCIASKALSPSTHVVTGRSLFGVIPDMGLETAFRAVSADGAPRTLELEIDDRLFGAKLFTVTDGVCIVLRAPARATTDDHLPMLFDALPAAVSLHHGPEHVVTSGNEQFRREIGVSRFVGIPAEALWPDEHDAFVRDELEAVYRSGEPILRTAVPITRRASAAASDSPSPVMRTSGEADSGADPAVIDDKGEREERYLTYSLTPVRGAAGDVVGVVRFAIDVTEEVLDRIQVEELTAELARGAERHRLVHRATNDTLWDWDVLLGRIEWSETIETHFGYAPSEVDETIEWRIARIHPEDRERVAGSLALALGGESSTWSAEYRLVRRDGSFADVLDRGLILRDPAGRAERFVGSIVDLSERKRLERALLESEARLRSSLAAANIGTWRVDLRTGVDVRDGTLNAIFGLGASETVSAIEDFIERVHPEDRAAVVSAIDGAVKSRGEYAIDFRIVRPDETVRWVRDVGRVLHDEHGPFAMTGALVDVTETRRAEEALRASELRYRSLVLATNHVVWTTDTQGRLTGTQPLWCAFTGQKLEVAAGDGWFAAIHPDDRDGARERWFESVARRRVHQAEFRVRRHDGTYRNMRIRAAPVLDDDLRVREWIATAVDVTESRTLEAQLEAVFDGAPIGIAMFDRDLRLLRVNAKMTELEGAADRAFSSAGEPRLRERLEGYHRQVQESGEAIMGVELRTPASPHFLLGFYPVRIGGARRGREPSGGDVQGTVAIALDITERKRVEESLAHLARTSQALASSIDLETTLANTAAAFVPHQADFAAVFLNDAASKGGASSRLAACVHRDHTRHDVLETALTRARVHASSAFVQLLRERVPLVSFEANEASLRELSASSDSASGLLSLGLGSYALLPLLLQDEAIGAVLIGLEGPARGSTTTLDVALATEMVRRASIAIQNARLFELARREHSRVEEANRAKDEFLAVVSHELRTPLNAMLGWSRMLRAGLPEDQARRAVDTIERNARAQAQLIEDLLDISRIITGKLRIKLEPLDLVHIVEAAIEVVQPAANAKGLSITCDMRDAAAPLVGDGDRLQQVLWNLLSNAVKFTPRGGRVAIRLERLQSACVVTVEDSGQGIHSDFLPHIFDRFRQAEGGTTRPHGGLGLGLAIVRHIAELHGGTVEASSDGLGHGSRFTLVLPIAPRETSLPLPFDRGQEPAPTSVRLAPKRPSLDGLRVLIVDDEPDARELMDSILSSSGARVETASSVDEALSLLRRTRVDVIVSDIAMPGEDGYSLIHHVRGMPRDEGGRTPAIALTAYARPEDRKRALEAGFSVHLSKPVEPTLLITTLVELGNGQH